MGMGRVSRMKPGSPPAWPPLVLVGVVEEEGEEEGAAAAVTWLLRFRRALRCWLRLLLLTISFFGVCVCLSDWLNVGRSLSSEDTIDK